MSFPKFPDIKPDIDLTYEQSINLIISSIALEEMSLSKLIDAETCKILHVLDKKILCCVDTCCCCCCKEPCQRDIVEINESVDRTIKDIIKLQMLLQFKLETVNKMLPSTSTCSTTATTSTTTASCTKTTTHTTTCSTCTCTTTSHCVIEGKCSGIIRDRSDEYNSCDAFIELEASSAENEKNYLHYRASNDLLRYTLDANVTNVNVSDNVITVKGKGKCTKKLQSGKESRDFVKYTLIINQNLKCCNGFEIIISSRNRDIRHRSGLIEIKSCKPEINVKCY